MKIRGNLKDQYSDVYTPAALGALEALASLDVERKALMDARIARRARAGADRHAASTSWHPMIGSRERRSP